ncbi:hypothetical protein Patl1_34537 [Pistacia atlantica]|uniref:Uncharacterized protein n=1 Tax=Pistacia atlantica TaxID=434234 RepID=A0ACC0ZRS4_9ROSI|nr:hypothetical protein Patl1_34537 [Pistacia atlantica]
MTYFKDIAVNGELDEVVKYLSGFTKSDDNEYSRLMFFEIRKQKYLEALDRGDIAKAVEILKELKRFSEFDDTTVKDLTYLLTLENFRYAKISFKLFKLICSMLLGVLYNLWPSTVCGEKIAWKWTWTTMLEYCKWFVSATLLSFKTGMGNPRQLGKNWNEHLMPTVLFSSLSAIVMLLDKGLSLTKQYSREVMLEKLNNWVLKNPVFHDKLQFPNLDDSRLTTLINQSLNWQHYMCISPKPYPDIKTLFMDHSCEPPNVNCDPSAVTKNIGFFTKEPVIFTSASSSNTRINVGIADGRVQLFPDTRQNGDTQFLPCVKSRVIDESQKYKIWRPIVINQSSGLRALRLQDSLSPEKVVKLMYTHAGSAIIALANNAMHKVWKWQKNEKNLSGKATSAVPPQLWLPSNGIKMSNDIEKINKENALPCFTLTKDDAHLLSASGGMVSLFMMQSFKVEYTVICSAISCCLCRKLMFLFVQLVVKCCPPPPAATCLAFHPKDNNIIAIGMDDSSILVYDIKFAKVKNKLTDHQHKVTGLAFSVVLNVLVSSGADAQLCVWSLDGWEKQASQFLKLANGCVPRTMSPTHVNFHQDQIHVLAVQKTQITVYKAPTLERLEQSFRAGPTGTIIMDAVYSCEGQSIYAALGDGSVAVLNATSLKLKQRIIIGEYVPSNHRSRIYAVAVAAHPSEPNQFALGLSHGGVTVLELTEAEASSS